MTNVIPCEFRQTSYLNLATRKRNGDMVRTPVWFAHDDEFLYVLSAGNAGKVKRLKNFSEAQVAICNFQGDLKGSWYRATAQLLDAREIPRAHQLFRRKYGWQMSCFDSLSKLGGRFHKRAYIRIKVLAN